VLRLEPKADATINAVTGKRVLAALAGVAALLAGVVGVYSLIADAPSSAPTRTIHFGSPEPNYTVDLVAEDIPGVIEDQLGETVAACEIDYVDRFVCERADAKYGPGDEYCYRFDLGRAGARDLEIGRTHYRDYEVRYLMIAKVPEPSDPGLYQGAPYRCRPSNS
jgi:hypothetical protein